MKKLLKFRPKKNTPYRIVNTQGVLLTLTSDEYVSPIRLANFWDKSFVDGEKTCAIKSRGNSFYSVFFTTEIDGDAGVSLQFENGYPDDAFFQEVLGKAQKCLVEVVDTRNPDIVLSTHGFDCNFSGGYHVLGLEDMQIPEFPKLF